MPTVKIRCPYCEGQFSVRVEKSGTYKPTCKQCGERFGLFVTKESPPKVRVGRLAKPVKSDPPEMETLPSVPAASPDAADPRPASPSEFTETQADAPPLDETVADTNPMAGQPATPGLPVGADRANVGDTRFEETVDSVPGQ
ncbi:MAG: hypothetical protein AAFP69_12020, partial [Planctomycetota bacterium]